MVKPARLHTRFERARIIGARALQIGMGAPLYAKEDELREEFKAELISLYGLEEASVRFVLDPLKIAVYESTTTNSSQSISILTSMSDSQLGESSDI